MPVPLSLGMSSACLGEAFGPEALPLMAAHGLTYLEIFPMDLPEWQAPAALASLGEQARAAGLVTWSLHAPFGHRVNLAAADETLRREAVGAVTGALEQAEALGATYVIVHAGYCRPGEEQRETALLRTVRSVNELFKRASQRGLKLAIEYLPPKPEDLTSSAAELLWLANLVDGDIYFCADVNHINLSEDLCEAVRALAERLVTTHLSDNDGVAEGHWLPGQGVIDLQPGGDHHPRQRGSAGGEQRGTESGLLTVLSSVTV